MADYTHRTSLGRAPSDILWNYVVELRRAPGMETEAHQIEDLYRAVLEMEQEIEDHEEITVLQDQVAAHDETMEEIADRLRTALDHDLLRPFVSDRDWADISEGSFATRVSDSLDVLGTALDNAAASADETRESIQAALECLPKPVPSRIDQPTPIDVSAVALDPARLEVVRHRAANLTGTNCPAAGCGLPQFRCQSGIVCDNGHGYGDVE